MYYYRKDPVEVQSMVFQDMAHWCVFNGEVCGGECV